MLTYWQLLLPALLLALLQEVPLDPAGRSGRLDFVVVDSLGHPIPGAPVQVEEIHSTGIAKRFPGYSGMHLEVGTYRLVVDPPGFRRAVKTVRIADKPVLVVIGTSVATHEARATVPEVAGRVPGLDPRLKCDWVRLIPMFLDEPVRDAPILLNQYFAFEKVEPGKYLAVVFGPDRICRTSELTIQGWKRQEVTVPAPGGRAAGDSAKTDAGR